MTNSISLSEAVRRHMRFHGLQRKSLAHKSGLHLNTIDRVLNEADYSPPDTTIDGLKKALRLDDFADIWRDPWELDAERRSRAQSAHPASQARPERQCIEIDDLPILLVQENGEPLNKAQQEVLKGLIDTIKRLGK